MSSHLLGEIERVCDHLVVIEGGQARPVGPIARSRGRIGLLTVEVDGAIERPRRAT